MVLLTATLNGAAETFPVIHNEPITVRILGGKDGLPLAHQHLTLLGGYDQSDLHDQLYRSEVLTDSHGQVKLPRQLANLPWLQVWVDKKPLCQAKPRGENFSVELIRRDGLSAPNRCGTATVEETPGVFTVFVKGKGKNAVAEAYVARAKAPVTAVEAARTALPSVEAPVRKPAAVEASLPAAQIPATPATTALPMAPAPVLTEKVFKPTEPVRPVAAVPATVPAPPPVDLAAKAPSNGPAKAESRPVRRVAARPVSHRARRPVLATCQVRHPAADPINATHKSKPAAGVRMAAITPDKPKAPPKQE
jgi:hypothetical protein